MIKRTYGTATLATATLAAFFAVILLPTVSSAAFTDDQLACREKIAKNGSKLATKASKELSTCHKKRSTGKLPPGTNCNDISVVDTKSKIAKTAAKLVDDANSTCSALNPGDLLYTGCPDPCDSEVPTISDFQDVADCIVCVVQNHAESVSFNGQGNPSAPMAKTEAKCHGAIGKNQTSFLKTIVKERVKCEKAAERTGTMDPTFCIGADPDGKIQSSENKGRAAITKLCTGADVSLLDSCSSFSLPNLLNCVYEEARVRGRLTVKSFYQLDPGGGITTTTFVGSTTTTTSTTIPGGGQDPQCPNLGELTLLAGAGGTCATNGDCGAGSTCDTGLGRCTTVTDLDTGWKGIAHNADINDEVVTLGNLICAGPAPVCGQCIVDGINPGTRSCRCANNNRTICDAPFAVDANDCGAGILCDCYFGPPLPLSAGNTPACILNRFSEDITGTANVDTGSGSITANLRSRVFLGIVTHTPCPGCGGTCTAGLVGSTCMLDEHCDTSVGAGDGTCSNYDGTANDGVRGGTCYLGLNDGQTCDVDASNTSFPANGGGGHSLDCFPNTSNVSGLGLRIKITQTTGMQSLSAAVPCGIIPEAPRTCACGECSNDTSVPCTSNADCVSPGECRALGAGEAFPNDCAGETCDDTGDGITGECATGPDNKYCDAYVRANGNGFQSCSTNGDCDPDVIGFDAGNCTLVERRACFLDPIIANGSADPTTPIGAGIFCIGRTANGAINATAGLPGPGRVVNQGRARTFCASDNNVQYTPGVGGCPP